jgi:hypothetical protein
MKPWTQSDTEHGNCWQTAVACILEVEAVRLPSQVLVESVGSSYWNAINSYLIDHHGLFYSELFDYQFAGVRIHHAWYGGYHLLIGPTIRTPVSGRNHVTVGRLGRVAWDPHPSRAGLTQVEKWGILGKANPVTQVEKRQWFRRPGQTHPDPTMWCLCPTCCPDPRRFIAEKTREGFAEAEAQAKR